MALRMFLVTVVAVVGFACSHRLEMSCPAVREGETADLHCFGSWGTHDRLTLWSKASGQHLWHRIAVCNRDMTCENYTDWSTISLESVASGFLLTLHLDSSRTNARNRNDDYECAVEDTTGKTHSTDKRHCKPVMFYLPKEPRCHFSSDMLPVWADSARPDKVSSKNITYLTVQCGPEIVHPGMVCKLREGRVDTNYIVDKHVEFEYSFAYINLNGQGYLYATCTATFLQSVPGTYRYSVEIRPSLKDELLRGRAFRKIHFNVSIPKSVEVPTLTTGITSSPTFTDDVKKPTVRVIQKAAQNYCPFDTKWFVVTCITMGFKYRPTFQWFIDGRIITDSRIISGCEGRKCHSRLYRRSVNTPLSLGEHGVTCVAKTSRFSINDTLKPSFLWPPQPAPQLTLNFASERENAPNLGRVHLTRGMGANMTCRAQNLQGIGNTSMHVLCEQRGELILRQMSHEAHLKFNLSGNVKNDTVCTCWAKWKKRCWDKTASITVELIDHRLSTSRESSDNSFIISITGGVLLCVVVVTLWCIVMHRKRFKRKKRHEYEYVDMDVMPSSGEVPYVGSSVSSQSHIYESVSSPGIHRREEMITDSQGMQVRAPIGLDLVDTPLRNRQNAVEDFNPYNISDQELKEVDTLAGLSGPKPLIDTALFITGIDLETSEWQREFLYSLWQKGKAYPLDEFGVRRRSMSL